MSDPRTVDLSGIKNKIKRYAPVDLRRVFEYAAALTDLSGHTTRTELYQKAKAAARKAKRKARDKRQKDAEALGDAVRTRACLYSSRPHPNARSRLLMG